MKEDTNVEVLNMNTANTVERSDSSTAGALGKSEEKACSSPQAASDVDDNDEQSGSSSFSPKTNHETLEIFSAAAVDKTNVETKDLEANTVQVESSESDGEKKHANIDYDSSNDDNDDFPEKYLCTISQEIMEEPVVASDGYTYDKKSLLKWVKQSGTSPMTRESMSENDWFVDKRLEKEIKDWLASNSEKSLVKQYWTDLEAVKKAIAEGRPVNTCSTDTTAAVVVARGRRRRRRRRDMIQAELRSNQRELFNKVFLVSALIIGVAASYFFVQTTTTTDSFTSSPTISPFSALPSCANDGMGKQYVDPMVKVSVELETDSFPKETIWKIWRNSTNENVLFGVDYKRPNHLYNPSYCLPADCYELTVFDTQGDGLLCPTVLLKNMPCFNVTYNDEKYLGSWLPVRGIVTIQFGDCR